jgi:hypothetical protein
MVEEMPCAGREEPNPMTRRLPGRGLAAAAGALGLLLTTQQACSGNGASVGMSCGPGTVAAKGECVSADGSVGGGLDSEAQLDVAITRDASADQGQDRLLQDGAVDERLLDDGAVPADAAAEPPDLSDMCPVPSPSVQCDPGCPNETASACAMAICNAQPTLELPQPAQLNTTLFEVRTPDRPGTDPRCVTQCPGDGYVYGLGLHMDWIGNIKLSVGPPWVIVRNDTTKMLCDANAKVFQGCAVFESPPTQPVFIMTQDPNAPARNVMIYQSNNTNVIPTCP